MVSQTYLVKRIELLQEELESLKKTILKRSTGKPVSMHGIWKGVEFSDEEMDEVTTFVSAKRKRNQTYRCKEWHRSMEDL